jgi:hypothetical protein
MGINSSAYSGGIAGNAGDAYIYSTGNNFLIGNTIGGKDIIFFTSGVDGYAGEQMRIGSDGNVTISTSGINHFNMDGYSTTAYPAINIRRSRSDTKWEKSTTTDGMTLGELHFYGVNNAFAPDFAYGGEIVATQRGNAGSGYIPTDIAINLSNGTDSPKEVLRISHDIVVETSGTVKTNKIAIASGAASGNVLSSIDEYGNAIWTSSSLLLGTSGYSGFSGFSGDVGISGFSGFSGFSGAEISKTFAVAMAIALG